MLSSTLINFLNLILGLAETSFLKLLVNIFIYFSWFFLKLAFYYYPLYTLSLALWIGKSVFKYLQIGFFKPIRQTENRESNNKNSDTST